MIKSVSKNKFFNKIPEFLFILHDHSYIEGFRVRLVDHFICFQDRVQTIVGDNPEESCSLDPQTTCKHVTKLVPSLKQVENCFDVPKEVCVRSEVNPRVVQVPVVKKWCYVVSCPDECIEVRFQKMSREIFLF